MRGELFSIVVSDCFDAVSERQKHACAGLHDRVRVLVRQFGELGVFGGSLDVRHDNAFVIGADNRVGLPVSDAAFCGDNRRPLIDIDAVRNQPAPRILALAPVVFFAAVTQVKIQRAPVFLVFPDMLIDALVTDQGDAILRQTPADLIGTPLLLRQFFFDQLHQIWRHFARLVRGLLASLRGLLVRLLEAIAARAGVANKLAADRRRIDANLPRNVGLRVAALQERVNLAALFAGQMEIAFGHFSSVRCAVPRKDSLHLTARKTGIHNMAKSGGRKRRPQGCSLRSHRLRRLKPLTPTLSPATHSAMPSMLPCCTSDLKRRYEKFATFLRNELVSNNLADFQLRKGLDHLDAVRERFQAITSRFAGFQAQWLNVHVDFPLLQRLALPITVSSVRYPGIKIHDPRVIRLLEVLLHGGTHVGGWTAKQIHHAVLSTFHLSEKNYGLNQLRYDLRKLKGHGLLQRDGSRYAYRLTQKGVQVALLFLFFHKRLCGPLAHSRFHHRPTARHQPASKLETAYHRADTAIQRIVDLLAA